MSESSNVITDHSGDPKYYIITPQIVLALCDNPYQYTLWNVIKNIAGELGECYLATDDLATMAMMSTGKCSESRKALIDKGLLQGEIRKDPGYPQPVWHLVIPNLWQDNIKWREVHQSLKERIELKAVQLASLHKVKPSPGEEGGTPREEGVTPRETKNNQQEKPKEQPPVKPSKNGNHADPLTDLPTYDVGNSQVAQPEGFQKHFGYRQEILQIYNEETNLVPNQGRKAALAELAAQPGFDPEKFRDVLHKFNVGGGSPYDIDKIAAAYNEATSKPKKLKPGEVDWGTGGGQQTLPDGRVIVW